MGLYSINKMLSGILLRLNGIESNPTTRTGVNLTLSGTLDADTVAAISLNATNATGQTLEFFDVTVNGTLETKGELRAWNTITAPATTGAQTIDKPMGRVNFALGATSLVVTNDLCRANSIILISTATNDADASKLSVVAGTGFFTLRFGVAPAAETAVNFLLIN